MKEITDAWEVVVDGKAALGEGAFWDSSLGVLFWVDIVNCQVHRFDPASGEDTFVTVPAQCGTVVPRDSGGLVVALPDQIAGCNPDWTAPSGSATPTEKLCDLEADKPLNRANDGKCDPKGRLWVGSIASSKADYLGALYRIGCDHSVTTTLESVTVGNGLCWNQSRGTMYYIDTPTRRVDVLDYDGESGDISNRRPLVNVPDGFGGPDGMTIDSKGDLWVAMWGGNAITHWDGESGELLARYEIPAEQVTSCAFGGPDLETLYVTSASVGLSEERLAQQPLAGNVFALQPGVAGLPMDTYCG